MDILLPCRENLSSERPELARYPHFFVPAGLLVESHGAVRHNVIDIAEVAWWRREVKMSSMVPLSSNAFTLQKHERTTQSRHPVSLVAYRVHVRLACTLWNTRKLLQHKLADNAPFLGEASPLGRGS